jgi:hypothetical protein
MRKILGFTLVIREYDSMNLRFGVYAIFMKLILKNLPVTQKNEQIFGLNRFNIFTVFRKLILLPSLAVHSG